VIVLKPALVSGVTSASGGVAVDENFDNYLPPMVEPGCSGLLNLEPCASDSVANIGTLDLILIPLVGVVVALVLYFQFKNQHGVKRPVVWAVMSGIAASAGYGARFFL